MVQASEKWVVFQAEILRIMYEHDRLVHESPQHELAIRRAENVALTEACARHKRELDWMAGIPITPMTHFTGPIVVRPVGELTKK